MSSWAEWLAQMQQASFRGVPFGVTSAEGRYGRRLAVHEYPKKDKPWAEDMGRSTRPIVITGFLITDSQIYGGGDVLAQRERLVAAAETKDSGPLIHPTLGALTVSVLDGGLQILERFDRSRYFEFTLAVVESGEREFPSDDDDTQAGTDAAADAADEASQQDYTDDVTPALEDGASIIDMAVRTAQSFVANVLAGATDATSLFNMLVDLPGTYGRFFTGRTTGFATPFNLPVSGATVDSLILQGTALRALVEAACDALVVSCGGTDTVATANAATNVTASLLSATANPADAVRILSGICSFFPNVITSPSISGMAEATMQTSISALFRRSTFSALARASALYQPSSADDAATLRQNLADLFQSEIDIAGDYPDDNSFGALRSLRAAVILDLNRRGAGLPQLQTVVSVEPMPACVLAQRLYQDAGRTDELVTEADPVHPAFMPLSFTALGD